MRLVGRFIKINIVTVHIIIIAQMLLNNNKQNKIELIQYQDCKVINFDQIHIIRGGNQTYYDL